MLKLLAGQIDGKLIAYTNRTVFKVQIGKGKGAYKTKWSFEGNLIQAKLYYLALNIGNGYKKRLIAHELNKPVLARQFS